MRRIMILSVIFSVTLVACAASDGTGETSGATDIVTHSQDDGTAGGDPTCAESSATLSLVANIETMGIVVEGDDLPSTAQVSYRAAGAQAWIEGHPALRIADGRLVGSLFGLVEATTYEVAVTTGAITFCGSATTQPQKLPFEPITTLHVDSAATEGGTGTESLPFRTIQEAVDVATPGTLILVADGVYHEEVDVGVSGTEGAWIKIVAEGEGAILDGSVPMEGPWSPHPTAADVWTTEVPSSVWYLARDGLRVYRYNDLDGLLEGLGDDAVPMDEGFYVEPGTTTLYVRCLDDPQSHSWQLPTLDRAFVVDGGAWVWIEGFTMRYYGQGEYGRGVYLKNSSHVVVSDNVIHGVPSGVVVRWTDGAEGGDDTRIMGNEIFDPPVADWPWDAVKGTSMEGSGIVVGGHTGAIVSGNHVHDFFNGIYTGRWGELDNTALALDADIYDNLVEAIGDDGFEPEGACINHRFHHNVFAHGHHGISLAPITQGPVWILASAFVDVGASPFKWSNGSSGHVLVYHTTSWTDTADHNGMTFGDTVHHVTSANNIIVGTRYAVESTQTGMTGHSWDFDCWYTSRTDGPHVKWDNERYDTLADLCAATALECNGIDLAPLLVDPSSGDVTQLPGSPTIDAGTIIPGIGWTTCGSAPDMGAHELCP